MKNVLMLVVAFFAVNAMAADAVVTPVAAPAPVVAKEAAKAGIKAPKVKKAKVKKAKVVKPAKSKAVAAPVAAPSTGVSASK